MSGKPFKVFESVDRREIDNIRYRAQTSPVDISYWADAAIAAIEHYTGERALSEHATRDEARAEVERRERSARPGKTWEQCRNIAHTVLRSVGGA